jgi:hypothetical protein
MADTETFLIGERVTASPHTWSHQKRGEIYGVVIAVESRRRYEGLPDDVCVVARMEKTGRVRGFLSHFVTHA